MGVRRLMNDVALLWSMHSVNDIFAIGFRIYIYTKFLYIHHIDRNILFGLYCRIISAQTYSTSIFEISLQTVLSTTVRLPWQRLHVIVVRICCLMPA